MLEMCQSIEQCQKSDTDIYREQVKSIPQDEREKSSQEESGPQNSNSALHRDNTQQERAKVL